MSFLKIAEILGGIFLMVFAVTQLMIPAWKNQKLFPWFRKSQHQLEEELEEAMQKKAEFDIKDVKQRTKITSFQRQRQRDKKWKGTSPK